MFEAMTRTLPDEKRALKKTDRVIICNFSFYECAGTLLVNRRIFQSCPFMTDLIIERARPKFSTSSYPFYAIDHTLMFGEMRNDFTIIVGV